VYGPGAAYIMTCTRLRWTVIDAAHVVTDDGVLLDLNRDPPAVVKNHCAEAVQRWRWRRLEQQFPQLARHGSGRGAFMEPIWQLLGTKTKIEGWNQQHKGALKSAVAGRQYPQTRVKQCGWSEHDRCLFCLWKIVGCEADKDESEDILAKKLSEATEEQLKKAPVGNYIHRIWECGESEVERGKHAEEADMAVIRQCEVRGHPTWERGLTVRPPKPSRGRAWCETLTWHVKPKSLPLVGACYTDGSCLEGTVRELARCGWAFTFINDEGEIIGSAYGVPPPWIGDIGGAEAWALLQALLVSLPTESKYWTDCLPLFEAAGKGTSAANDYKNVLARVHNMIMIALEDCGQGTVGWMPAHLAKADLVHEEARKSDGSKVTELDLAMNEISDGNAKRAVEHHRVPAAEVKRWHAELELAKSRAMWVGMATHLANSSETFPYRDSEAARRKAKAAQRRKADAKNGIDGRRRRNGALGTLERTPLQGGHQLVKAETGHGWLCTTCRMRSVNKKRLSVRRCPGAKKSAISCSPESSPLEGKPHSLRMSGSIIWCGVCGSFTESRVSRLKSMCRGPPPQSLGTG
jgi:hypothetical protein